MAKKNNDPMEKIVSVCKRRGFIFPTCEIYGGFANSYSYGPYGAQLKKNIKNFWWNKFVEARSDIVGIDGPILLHPELWKASGHVDGFNDAMVDCKKCNKRFRADHLIIELIGEDLEGDFKKMTKVLKEDKLKCPECGASDWTEVRVISMMFQTEMNGINEPVYLRPETAGAIFAEFKNITDSMRVKIPFGIAQVGKAFRNEIVARNFIFRVREFEQMEIEYFIDPSAEWEGLFDKWLELQIEFTEVLGVKKNEMRTFEHPKEKLSHYSKKTIDIEYKFPFGWGELFGLAHRGDFDLSAHSEASNEKLEYFDQATNSRYTPHVLEPTFGLDRALLAAICSAYEEEKLEDDTRIVLKFPKAIAPVKVAIFPLVKNKEVLTKKARELYDDLKNKYLCEYDEAGTIGKRYRRQDEIGTPYCVTVDFDTIEKDDTVTVRDRDTMEQTRIKVEDLDKYLKDSLEK